MDGATDRSALRRWMTLFLAMTASAAAVALVVRAFTGVGAPVGARDGSGPNRALRGEVDGVYELYHPGRDEGELWVVGPGGAVPLGVEGILPEISPAAEAIAFAGDVEEAGNVDIYTVGVDGTGLRRLTTDPHVDTSPSWSPDGRWIAFEREDGEGHAEIFIVAADGSDERQLTNNDETNDGAPDWSPDGGTILFTRYIGTNAEILAVGPEGGKPTRLTTSAGYDGGAEWSPDGGRIAFVRDPEEDGTGELWVMAPDGSDGQLLANVSAEVFSLAWSPDGSTVGLVTGNPLQGDGQVTAVALDGSEAPSPLPGSLVPELQAGWQILSFELLLRPVPH